MEQSLKIKKPLLLTIRLKTNQKIPPAEVLDLAVEEAVEAGV